MGWTFDLKVKTSLGMLHPELIPGSSLGSAPDRCHLLTNVTVKAQMMVLGSLTPVRISSIPSFPPTAVQRCVLSEGTCA